MRRETPVLAGVTETAAGDIESADFGGNSGKREDHNRAQSKSTAHHDTKIETQDRGTENFQPRKIKRERNTDRPRQNFVIIDVAGELNWIKCFERTGVNKDSGENEIENSRENTPDT